MIRKYTNTPSHTGSISTRNTATLQVAPRNTSEKSSHSNKKSRQMPLTLHKKYATFESHPKSFLSPLQSGKNERKRDGKKAVDLKIQRRYIGVGHDDILSEMHRALPVRDGANLAQHVEMSSMSPYAKSNSSHAWPMRNRRYFSCRSTTGDRREQS
jgi:hypothetical protein